LGGIPESKGNMPAGKYCITCGHPKMLHHHNKRKDGKMYYHGCIIVYRKNNEPCHCKQYVEPEPIPAESRPTTGAADASPESPLKNKRQVAKRR